MTAPLIEISSLCMEYPGPPSVRALHNLNLVVSAGDYLAIMGASGSGKSTLLNVLGLLDAPTAGSYRFDGLDTSQLSESQRAAFRCRTLGFVFQSFHLLPYRTAFENASLPLLYAGVDRETRNARARDALATVGLAARADSFPTTLSRGERQRVAIARAIINGPQLLLCDEPTGNLDSANAASVMDLVDRLRSAALTIIVITHDAAIAARADRRIVMHDGTFRYTVGGQP
jgi:putative ABC transport system ATP-binding protein